jgi:pilus assembly protein CpaB
MERRNLIIAAAAIVLGLVAVYIANSWFSGVEQRQERAAAEQELVRIAVANRPLEFGDELTQDNVRLASWPANSVPEGAYTDVGGLLGRANVAIRPIAAGEPVLRARISDRAVLSANLPGDMRAVTVPVNAVTGVAGFVTPGDVVDVLLTRQIPGDGSANDDKMTTIILENVQVLAVDRRSSEKNTQPNVGRTATLQVDPLGAQKLALATEVGRLSLALRNVENQIVGARSTVTTAQLDSARYYIRSRSQPASAPAQQPVLVYAGAPQAAQAAAAPIPTRPRGPSMSVFRGTEERNEEVQRYGS